MKKSFEGVVLQDATVSYKKDGGAVAGARATVDTDGEIVRRFTASRLLLMGPFALAFKKKKDQRGLYLIVEGDGFAFVVDCNPKKGIEARKFAALINVQSQRAAAALAGSTATTTGSTRPEPEQIAPQTPPPASKPAEWYRDPGGQFDYRYWDGSRWTEHVANEGDATAYTDPVDDRA